MKKQLVLLPPINENTHKIYFSQKIANFSMHYTFHMFEFDFNATVSLVKK
jgi:hypothetical protein